MDKDWADHHWDRKLPNGMNVIENKVNDAFNRIGLYPKTQYKISGLIVDFAFLDERLIIEINGPIHNRPDINDKDIRKWFFLKNQGWIRKTYKYDENNPLDPDKVAMEVKQQLYGKDKIKIKEPKQVKIMIDPADIPLPYDNLKRYPIKKTPKNDNFKQPEKPIIKPIYIILPIIIIIFFSLLTVLILNHNTTDDFKLENNLVNKSTIYDNYEKNWNLAVQDNYDTIKIGDSAKDILPFYIKYNYDGVRDIIEGKRTDSDCNLNIFGKKIYFSFDGPLYTFIESKVDCKSVDGKLIITKDCMSEVHLNDVKLIRAILYDKLGNIIDEKN